MRALAEDFHGAAEMGIRALFGLPLWLAIAGVAMAWYGYLRNPEFPKHMKRSVSGVYALLDNKYYLDKFNDWFFAGGARLLGSYLWRFGDLAVIDGVFVNGSARLIGFASKLIRLVQSGRIYHYAFSMVFGVFGLLTWMLYRLAR